LLSALSLDAGVQVEADTAPAVIGPEALIGLLLSAGFGLIVGFAGLGLVGSENHQESRIKRAIALAVTTSFTLSAGYLMLISGRMTRLVLASFSLALAICVMFNYILSRYGSTATAADADLEAEILEERAPGYDLPSPLAQRVHNLHHRIRHRNIPEN
jgi:Ca2+/Na+ antiporter